MYGQRLSQGRVRTSRGRLGAPKLGHGHSDEQRAARGRSRGGPVRELRAPAARPQHARLDASRCAGARARTQPIPRYPRLPVLALPGLSSARAGAALSPSLAPPSTGQPRAAGVGSLRSGARRVAGCDEVAAAHERERAAPSPTSAIAAAIMRIVGEGVREADAVGADERACAPAAQVRRDAARFRRTRAASPSWPCAARAALRAAWPLAASAAVVCVRDAVLEDRAEPGDAGRDPDLAEGAVDARGHAAARGGHDADRGRGQRRVDQADAGAGEQEARGSAPSSRSVASTAVIASSPPPTSSRPVPSSRRTGTRTRQPPGDRRDDERQQRDRQEAQAGLQRAVAEHVLDVERQVQEHREHRRRERERDDARAGERRAAEQR